MNKRFSVPVPTVNDPDIKQMIKQYPLGIKDEEQNELDFSQTFKRERLFGEDPNDPVIIALKAKNSDPEKKKLHKKAFESMIMKIDFMERKNKTYYQELLTKMVQQNIRDDELLKLTDALKEIDYSEPD